MIYYQLCALVEEPFLKGPKCLDNGIPTNKTTSSVERACCSTTITTPCFLRAWRTAAPYIAVRTHPLPHAGAQAASCGAAAEIVKFFRHFSAILSSS